MADRKQLITLGAAAGLGVLIVILLSNSGEREDAPSEAQNPAFGDGALEIYLYEDYQCSHCRDYALGEAFEHLYDTWVATDQVRLVWKHVAFVGEHSAGAAIASQCVYRLEPTMWLDFDHALYQDQLGGRPPSPANVRSIAVDLGVNEADFESCRDADTAGKALLDNNIADLSASGATGTPSLVIAGTAYNPEQTDAVDAAIQEALGEA